MNGEQARHLQNWMGQYPGVNPMKSPMLPMKDFIRFRMLASEVVLFEALWDEFYPDLGNLYRLPMMVREEE